jgi:hypothetical protein
VLEKAAAVWGTYIVNEYLKGKTFILFTDHKHWEKMHHLHTKTMDQFFVGRFVRAQFCHLI